MREGPSNCQDVSATASWCHLKVEVRGSDGDFLSLSDAVDKAMDHLKLNKDSLDEWVFYNATPLEDTAWIVVFTLSPVSIMRISGRVTCS